MKLFLLFSTSWGNGLSYMGGIMRNYPALSRYLLLSCAVSAMVVQLYIFQTPIIGQIDLRVYDSLLKASDRGTPSQCIGIVDIDEKSLREMGQWPWPRYRLATLLERLAASGASAVGIDVLLAEPDRTSIDSIRQSLADDLSVDIAFTGLPEELADNDALLAETLKNVPAVLGTKFEYSSDNYLSGNDLSGNDLSGKYVAKSHDPLLKRGSVTPVFLSKSGAPSPEATIVRASNGIAPLPIFAREAPLGGIDVSPDMDGVIRSVPLVTSLYDGVYVNLGLRTLMRALDSPQVLLQGGEYGLEAIRIKGLEGAIPVSPSGMMHVPFKGGEKTYKYFSAADIIKGRVPRQDIEGKILFIGSSAAGLLDMRTTPYSSVYPGVEVHAAIVDAVLQQVFIRIPAWTPAAQVAAITGMGLLCLLLFALTGPAVYIPAGIIATVISITASQWFWEKGFFLSPTYVILNIGLQALALMLLRLWYSERQKKHIHKIFGQYVAPEIVDRIVASGKNYCKGEERHVTVMFTDIRNFTAIAERLNPEHVVDLLNCYFTPLTALIRNNKGTLDKFIGDALMAFWNAPVTVKRHEALAVETALSIGESLHGINDELHRRFGVRLRMGIGIHSGPVYVGNMGSEELVEYTVIGDTVNTASRLEGLCARYGLPIVVSDNIRKACPEAGVFIHIDDVVLRGKSELFPVYTVLRPTQAQQHEKELALFFAARQAMADGHVAKACALFETLCCQYPDSKVYRIVKQRAQNLCSMGLVV